MLSAIIPAGEKRSCTTRRPSSLQKPPRRKPAISREKRQSALRRALSALPDDRLSAPRGAPPPAAFRFRIFRRRLGQGRCRHQAQLGGARCGGDGAALWRDAGAAAVRRRIVRPPLRRADRHCADGRTGDRVAGRRQASRPRRAKGARSLYARPRRRRDHRRDRGDRARRLLVSALPRGEERSRHRLRSGAPRRGDRLQRADPHAGRAGAHHARPRSGGRARRQRLSSGCCDADANAVLAALDLCADEKWHPAFRDFAGLCRRQRFDQRCDRIRAARDGRRLHLGGSGAISGPLEEDVDRERYPASAGRRKGGLARRRWHVRVEPRRAADRCAAGPDRCAAGDRETSREVARR